ncbi:MAG: hypothetical protein LAT57_11695 [Balneolales bacterium]|nr:hypothetical protein [Balneolales bacterium]
MRNLLTIVTNPPKEIAHHVRDDDSTQPSGNTVIPYKRINTNRHSAQA